MVISSWLYFKLHKQNPVRFNWFDYLTFKVKRAAGETVFHVNLFVLSFVSMATAEDLR